MEAQKMKALAYFGEILNKSKYNEDDRQFCQEHRSLFAASMAELGNEEDNSINHTCWNFRKRLGDCLQS